MFVIEYPLFEGDESVFHAHRIVLASTIPYFHAMFTHDMVESTQREITIQGVEATSMEAMINFAYNDLLDEARDYHLMPERRPLLQSFKTKPRCCKEIVGVIYAVGGQTKSGNSLSTVEVYDPILGRWRNAEAMSMLRSRVGVAVMENRLYAIGGYNGTDRLNTVELDGIPDKCSVMTVHTLIAEQHLYNYCKFAL
ncbi:hypothetical protein TCAL_14274 [Tigriopus californicus]|uniref:BTB domain-containing protein n=1 Tax=Tigriopus californicus TaxID=6832 RepID=A0A553NT09_TIGCA|nr:hypothetical protein TCAL_14274 [Tigriopus californicus]